MNVAGKGSAASSFMEMASATSTTPLAEMAAYVKDHMETIVHEVRNPSHPDRLMIDDGTTNLNVPLDGDMLFHTYSDVQGENGVNLERNVRVHRLADGHLEFRSDVEKKTADGANYNEEKCTV